MRGKKESQERRVWAASDPPQESSRQRKKKKKKKKENTRHPSSKIQQTLKKKEIRQVGTPKGKINTFQPLKTNKEEMSTPKKSLFPQVWPKLNGDREVEKNFAPRIKLLKSETRLKLFLESRKGGFLAEKRRWEGKDLCAGFGL